MALKKAEQRDEAAACGEQSEFVLQGMDQAVRFNAEEDEEQRAC